ncbi:hypothetical protein [Maribacter sp.]|uniref:hypothetical protein n=1 Tax=Maribacter sp. TaxID=1897614 RepID=UPI0025B864C7|nr:hypothetical protein [Maribacter sp.]|tara:strand:+ start:1421 stop:1729 length:309 start_codon:yes stop_codon:yes gene_type:complete
MDYSKIKINGQKLTQYRPTKYLVNHKEVFNTSYPFKLLMAFCILDLKGSVRILASNDINIMIHLFYDMDFHLIKDGGVFEFMVIPVHRQLDLDYSKIEKTAN